MLMLPVLVVCVSHWHTQGLSKATGLKEEAPWEAGAPWAGQRVSEIRLLFLQKNELSRSPGRVI